MKVRTVRQSVVIILSSVLFALSAPAATKAKPEFLVDVVTDRADALYHVGEKAGFVVTLKPSGQGQKFTYALSLDGVGSLGKGEIKFEAGRATVSGSLAEPGILRCTVRPSAGPRTWRAAMAGAAFDPQRIAATAVAPPDFDEFWKAQKAKLAEVPMDAQLEPVAGRGKVEVFKITLANVNGSRVHGWLGKPKGPGPFPAILGVPGAGVGSIGPGSVMGYATQGFLSMFISVHDIDNGQPPAYYEELKAGKLRGYPAQGREDRTTYYFYRVFLGCVRAVDYLTSRPEWDRKHVIVQGSSQGGALSLVTAGLDERITGLAANVPAMCDHSGRAHGRPSGWPQLVPAGKDGKLDAKVLAVSGYYDAVNFARRTTVPSIVAVGLIDTTCPATTVFSAYNALRGPKQIDIAPLMGHSSCASYRALKGRWILEQAGLRK